MRFCRLFSHSSDLSWIMGAYFLARDSCCRDSEGGPVWVICIKEANLVANAGHTTWNAWSLGIFREWKLLCGKTREKLWYEAMINIDMIDYRLQSLDKNRIPDWEAVGTERFFLMTDRSVMRALKLQMTGGQKRITDVQQSIVHMRCSGFTIAFD